MAAKRAQSSPQTQPSAAFAVPPGQRRSTGKGISSLVLIFVIWKLLLLAIACTSPGPGYDTSTAILLDQNRSPPESWVTKSLEHLVLHLTRWDGIYFAHSSARGHVHEQEWAFSWVLARVTSALARVFLPTDCLSPVVKSALVYIFISHLAHLGAVTTLYKLTFYLIPGSGTRKHAVAFTVACLHIVSPAGLFLSAPYGESTFACLNITGMLCYLLATKSRLTESSILAPTWTICAGLLFGIACTIRSNGLLSGVLFAWDAIEALSHLPMLLHHPSHFLDFATTILAGSLVAAGFAAPQVVAYLQYCVHSPPRPWCSRFPPSIYNWVQDYYWEVGFLRYWTLNNLPLFLLAAPMVGLLVYTSYLALFHSDRLADADILSTRRGRDVDITGSEARLFRSLLPRFALPQLILTLLVTTTAHVQILNRISSGYPAWYIILAIGIHSSASPRSAAGEQSAGPSPADTMKSAKQTMNDRAEVPPPGTREPGSNASEQRALVGLGGKTAEWTVKAMVMYAIVQAGLYASFLPPA